MEPLRDGVRAALQPGAPPPSGLAPELPHLRLEPLDLADHGVHLPAHGAHLLTHPERDPLRPLGGAEVHDVGVALRGERVLGRVDARQVVPEFGIAVPWL